MPIAPSLCPVCAAPAAPTKNVDRRPTYDIALEGDDWRVSELHATARQLDASPAAVDAFLARVASR